MPFDPPGSKQPQPPFSTLLKQPQPPPSSVAKKLPDAQSTRVQNAYKQLSLAAVSLNSASDELGKAISVLDAALKKLNLGISAWVTLSENDGTDQGQGWWWKREFGYTKIRDRWGIAIKTSSGHYENPDGDSEETWLFNDAPRWMRTDAVGMIPELLEALLKQAENTTKGIEKKTAHALELATAIDAVAQEAQSAEQK